MAFGSVVLSFLWTLENHFVGGYESSNFWSLLERSVSLALLAYVGSIDDGQWQEVLLKNKARRIKQIRMKYWHICTFDVLLVSGCLWWKVDTPVSSSTFDVIFIRLNHFIKLASLKNYQGRRFWNEGRKQQYQVFSFSFLLELANSIIEFLEGRIDKI